MYIATHAPHYTSVNNTQTTNPLYSTIEHKTIILWLMYRLMYSLHATNTTKNNTVCTVCCITYLYSKCGHFVKESAKLKHMLEVMNSLKDLYFKKFYLDKYYGKQNLKKSRKKKV